MTGTLTERGLSALLALLDADPALAATLYEAQRVRLIRFFAWKGVRTPEECADETIDRVARRLAEGETIRSSEPVRYFHGVARNVLREHWARADREQHHRALWPKEALAPQNAPAAVADCLHRCLEALDPEERRLALEYYDGTGSARVANRRAMAAGLGLPVASLRVRMHRLRLRLEACATRCLGTSPETFDPSRSPMVEDDEDGSGRD